MMIGGGKSVCRFRAMRRCGALASLSAALVAFTLWRNEPSVAADSGAAPYRMNLSCEGTGGGFLLPGSVIDVCLIDRKTKHDRIVLEKVRVQKVDLALVHRNVQAVLDKVPLLKKVIEPHPGGI